MAIGNIKKKEKRKSADTSSVHNNVSYTEATNIDKVSIKRRVIYWFSYAMRHNDANKMITRSLPYALFPEFI